MPGCARPAAAVIIPAHRAAGTIAACLRGLQGQDLDEPVEVVVVASGGDATPAIVGHGFPAVTVIVADGRLTPGACRSLGVRATAAPVVAFLAADCVPDPQWLRRRVEAHREGYDLVAGFVDCARPSTVAGYAQFFAKFWGVLALEGERSDARGILFHLSYRREVLDVHGPFLDVLAGEDTELNDRARGAGCSILFDSAIRVVHLNARTMREVLAGQREQGAHGGAACRVAGLDRYHRPTLQGGPLTPLRLWLRGLAAVVRRRRDLLGAYLVSAPLTVIAIGARGRAFRRAHRAGVPPLIDAPGRLWSIDPSIGARPDVTAIVPVYEEEAVLGRCLDALLAQRGVSFEIVVADDGSHDRSVSVAATRGVPVLCLDHRGPAAAKNAGAAIARGRALVFVDADLVPEPGFLARLAEPILAGREIGTFTKTMTVANPDDRWSRCWSLNRRAAPGSYLPDGLPDRWRNFRAVDRRAFLAVGGYDDVGYGEDMTLATKLGALAAAVPYAAVQHHNPDSVREIWSNARWVGKGPAVRGRPGVARRYTPWSAVRRGVHGAFASRLPRYVVFAVLYDTGVLTGYVQSQLFPRASHAK